MRPDQRRTQDPRAGGLLEGERRRAVGAPDLRVYREGTTVTVSWSLTPAQESLLYAEPPEDPEDPLPGEAGWAVERSSSPGGPFRLLHTSILPPETRLFRDDDPGLGLKRTRALFYRLKLCRRERLEEGFGPWNAQQVFGYNAAYHQTGSGSAVFGQTWGPAGKVSSVAPGPVRAIRQALDTLIRQRSAHLVLVYRAQWDTGACPACMNPMTGTRVLSNCPSCLNTGYAGAYANPLVSYWVPPSVADRIVTLPNGQAFDQHDNIRVLMPYWPPVAPDDVLRTPESELFTVTSVEHSPMYGYPTLCLAGLSELPATHPLSGTPFPNWFREVSVGPRRQHGRATNLDSYRRSLVDGAMAAASAAPVSAVFPDLDE